MCSYTAINGEPACPDEATLGGVLRRSFGFDGVIATDCGALADAHLHHKRYASEVEADIGRAVDAALGMGTLWVIHGHGSGALKKRVRELLSEEPMVKRMTDAPQNEGGAGCTVAYLR